MLSQAVRERFRNCSTGGRGWCGRVGCYFTKQHAVHEFDKALHYHGFYLTSSKRNVYDFPTDNGHATLPIYDMGGNRVGYAIIRWRKMPSGTYNFAGYIASSAEYQMINDVR